MKLQYDENRQQYAGRGRRERATHQVHNMRREGRGWGGGGKGCGGGGLGVSGAGRGGGGGGMIGP